MENIMNSKKNISIVATAALTAFALVVGIWALASTNVYAASSYVSSIDYTTSSGSSNSSYVSSIDYNTSSSNSNDGGNYNGGCCKTTTVTTPKVTTPSYVSSIDYSYPATKYTTPTYTAGYTTYTSTGGGCTSNCGNNCLNNANMVGCSKPAPTCTISVSQSSITHGQAVVVSWSSHNATQGSISNLGTNVAMSGSYTLYPSQSTTFTGTFTGNGKTVTCVTNVAVIPPPQYCPAGYTGTYPNCVPPVQYCPSGYTGTYPNCYPPVQYCPAGYTGTYPNCYPPVQHNNPSCTITINNYNNNTNGYYNPNQAVTISWNSSYAQSGFINNGMGSVALSGTRTVYPTQTTTYTGTFYGQNGQSVTCAATVYVNAYIPPVNPSAPYVTLAAVPYTGLELGPVGTVVYWGFIAFWCLLAAYLIAVKKVQNQVYAALKGILFGSNETAAVAHTPAAHATVAHEAHTAPVVRNEDAVDSFIIQQIHRARA